MNSVPSEPGAIRGRWHLGAVLWRLTCRCRRKPLGVAERERARVIVQYDIVKVLI